MNSYAAQIKKINAKMEANRVYLRAKYDALTPEIRTEIAGGVAYAPCFSCGFEASRVGPGPRQTRQRAGAGTAKRAAERKAIGWRVDILSLHEREPTPIGAGMVLHLVPVLLVDGEVGLAVSETVIVTETGAEVVRRVSRELAVG